MVTRLRWSGRSRRSSRRSGGGAFEIVPASHHRRGQLPVRGDDQVPVIASEPFLCSCSSRAQCCGLSFSRDTGPWTGASRSRRPARACATLHLPRRDPQVPGDLVDPSPWANRSAACSRSRSRRYCSACTRPVAHTACPGHTPAASRRHDPNSTSSSWLVLQPDFVTCGERAWTRNGHRLMIMVCDDS
jgi:hypothetical protein